MSTSLPKIKDYFDLSGKSALVTGATGALGSVAAKSLAGAGASVPWAGAKKEQLDEQVRAINAAGGRPTV